jgi:hypothetical protein
MTVRLRLHSYQSRNGVGRQMWKQFHTRAGLFRGYRPICKSEPGIRSGFSGRWSVLLAICADLRGDWRLLAIQRAAMKRRCEARSAVKCRALSMSASRHALPPLGLESECGCLGVWPRITEFLPRFLFYERGIAGSLVATSGACPTSAARCRRPAEWSR